MHVMICASCMGVSKSLAGIVTLHYASESAGMHSAVHYLTQLEVAGVLDDSMKILGKDFIIGCQNESRLANKICSHIFVYCSAFPLRGSQFGTFVRFLI